MCKHHLGTIRQLNAKLDAAKGDSAFRKKNSTFAQLQDARTTKQIKSLESEVVALQEEVAKLQKQNARISRSGNRGESQHMQETIVRLKAKLRECSRGEGHGEALHNETLQDQLSKADSTATSHAYKLTQEKLAVESQKMEIAELKSKLEATNAALDKQLEEYQGFRDEMGNQNEQVKWAAAQDEEHMKKLEAELGVATKEVERLKLAMDRSRSSWEGKVGELTTELERLRVVNVKCSGAAAEESCFERDEAAALALTDMRALTTQSQGQEVSYFVQAPSP